MTETVYSAELKTMQKVPALPIFSAMKEFTLEEAEKFLSALSHIRTRSTSLSDGKVYFQYDFLCAEKERLYVLSTMIPSKQKTIEHLRAANPPVYMLRIHLQEDHSVESLVARASELTRLARSLGIDGIDEISGGVSG